MNSAHAHATRLPCRPPDLKAVLDKASGTTLVEPAGTAGDKAIADGRRIANDGGNETLVVDPDPRRRRADADFALLALRGPYRGRLLLGMNRSIIQKLARDTPCLKAAKGAMPVPAPDLARTVLLVPGACRWLVHLNA
jgi:hypothetical protein